jgi:uncharacterized protein (DUF488 family)
MALLELFGGELEKIRLQKLLFLFSMRQSNPEYEFIPYKYGCYSYSVNADLVTMADKNLLVDNSKSYIKNDSVAYSKALKEDDRQKLKLIHSLFSKMSTEALIKHTYKNYPYWAINSIKAAEILDAEGIEKISEQRPCKKKTVLFTLGYEGESLEGYLNKLIKNDIHALIDVRKNPLSMKFGFNKNQLKKYCESVGIAYIHYPEVGINGDQRQELHSQADYDKLFDRYKKTVLPATKECQKTIFKDLIEHKRIALTCFEANSCQCHRRPLAEEISKLPHFIYDTVHL